MYLEDLKDIGGLKEKRPESQLTVMGLGTWPKISLNVQFFFFL